MTEPDEQLSPGEEQLAKELITRTWAFDRLRLEWRALYAGVGMDVSDRQLYLDAKKVVSGEPGGPHGDADEILSRASVFLVAAEALSDTLETAKAEFSLERGPERLNWAIENMRRLRDEGEA